MGQPVAFFEVISPDHERAQTFRRELSGWQVAADPARQPRRFTIVAVPGREPGRPVELRKAR